MNLESSHSYSIKQVPDSVKTSKETSLKPATKEEEEELTSRSSISNKIQEAVKINQNVKDALRSIAEKQKKNNILELIQK
jgi:hypothetical protein